MKTTTTLVFIAALIATVHAGGIKPGVAPKPAAAPPKQEKSGKLDK